MAFWTDKDVEPLQKYRYRVVTNLKKYDSIKFLGIRNVVGKPTKPRTYSIPFHLISSIDIPPVSVEIQNVTTSHSQQVIMKGVAADLGELVLKLVMTPNLMKEIPLMVQTYIKRPLISKLVGDFEYEDDFVKESKILIYF